MIKTLVVDAIVGAITRAVYKAARRLVSKIVYGPAGKPRTTRR